MIQKLKQIYSPVNSVEDSVQLSIFGRGYSTRNVYFEPEDYRRQPNTEYILKKILSKKILN